MLEAYISHLWSTNDRWESIFKINISTTLIKKYVAKEQLFNIGTIIFIQFTAMLLSSILWNYNIIWPRGYGGGGAALQKVGSACCVISHLDCLGLMRKNFLSKSLNLDKIQSKITRCTLFDKPLSMSQLALQMKYHTRDILPPSPSLLCQIVKYSKLLNK